MSRTPFLAILLAAICADWPLGAGVCKAQTSTWVGSSGNWFDQVHWDNGIPNAAGAGAKIVGNATNVELNQQATVGELSFAGPRQESLTGTGLLLFDQPGATSAALRILPNSAGAAIVVSISNPLAIAAGEELSVDVPQSSSISLTGAITSSEGDITKTGVGTLTLGVANPNWNGRMSVAGGSVIVANANALGTTSGDTVISSNGSLTLQHPNSEVFQFDGGTLVTSTASAITLSAPMHLIGAGTIRNGSTTVASTLNSVIDGPGDLKLQNDSTATMAIGGANSYTGHTYTSGTSFRATSANSFGAAAEGTTIQSGTVTLDALVSERFLVKTGGTLSIGSAAASYALPVALDGGTFVRSFTAAPQNAIVVGSNGGTVQFTGENTIWTGGSSGPGSLKILGVVAVNAPLTHTGNLIVERAQLNGANTHQGETILLNHSAFNHAGAVANSSLVRVQGGVATINALPSNSPMFAVERGWLAIADLSQPFVSAIRLGGEVGDATITTAGILNGPIELLPGSSRRIIEGGTVNGGISGNADLRLMGSPAVPIHLNSANDIRGALEVIGLVNVNHVNALNDASTYVSGGRLNLNVPAKAHIITNQVISSSATGALKFSVPQNVSEPWVVNAGVIETSAEVGMSKVILLGLDESALVRGTEGGGFRVDGTLDVYRAGAIDGGIFGNGDIRAKGARLTATGNLQGFTGDYHVQSGSLEFGELASGFNAPASINSSSQLHVYNGAVLKLNTLNNGDISNDIFLHNAQGANGFAGSLGSGGTLRGRLDVGDSGSTISGSFRIEGSLTGGTLTHSFGALEIATSQVQPLEALRFINQATLRIAPEGRIAVPNVSLANGSKLYFGPASATDRFDDSIQLGSDGGDISLVASNNFATSEVLGTLHLQGGSSGIFVSSDHDSQPASLTINQLLRERGSVLGFTEAGFLNTTRILSGATLDNGILGPWAIRGQGFATLDANGNVLSKVATTFSDINSAGADDHVRVIGNQFLIADRSIASLQYDPSGSPAALNLNGHLLTVVSGGVRRNQEISNGRLTAGTGANAEMIFHDARQVSADIVDNAAGGSVSVVVSS